MKNKIFLCFGMVVLLCLTFVSADWTSYLNEGLFAYYNCNSATESLHGGDYNLIDNSAGGEYVTFGKVGGSCATSPSGAYNKPTFNISKLADNQFAFNTSGDATINMWINSNDTLYFYYLQFGDGEISYNYRMVIGGYKFNFNGFSYELWYGDWAVPTNTWVMTTYTRNSTSACMYVDGSLILCETNEAMDNNAGNFVQLLGTECGATTYGYMDELGFWNRTLNDAEISTLYNSGAGITWEPPSLEINITYPMAIIYAYNITNLNYTYNYSNPDSCWYSRDGGTTNSTPVTTGINFTDVISAEGNNTWTLFCNDTLGNLTTRSVNFLIVTMPPTIYITFPLNNQHYNYNITNLNYTIINLTSLSSCWYSLDSGTTNITIICGKNVTGLFASNGTYAWTLYANDTDNRLGIAVTTFYLDITPPFITWYNPYHFQNPFVKTTIFSLNVSAFDNYLDAINISVINSSGNFIYTNFTGNITSVTTLWINDLIPLNEGNNFVEVCARDSLTNSPIINNTAQFTKTNAEETTFKLPNGNNVVREIVIRDKNKNKLSASFVGLNTTEKWINGGRHYKTSWTMNNFPNDASFEIVINYLNNDLELLTDRNITRIVDKDRTYYWSFKDLEQAGFKVSYEWKPLDNKIEIKVTKGKYVNITEMWYLDPIVGGLNTKCSRELIRLDTNAPKILLLTPLNDTYSHNFTQNFSAIINDVGVGIKNITFHLYNSTSLYNLSTFLSASKYQYCYQEFANVSTDCGGLNTGSYWTDGDFYIWNGSSYETGHENLIYDGNWNTFAYRFNGRSFFYINYTIPPLSSDVIWKVKYNYVPTINNFTIPNDCLLGVNLQLKLESCHSEATYCPYGQQIIRGNCFNYSSDNWYEIFYNGAVGIEIWEEAIFWNTSSQNFSVSNLNILTPDNYTWNFDAYDNSNNYNISENFTLTIDINMPLISFTDGTLENGANVSQSNIYINTTWTETNFQNITFKANENIYTTTSLVYSHNFTGLADGYYYYNVTVCDKANNCNVTETRIILLDTVAPNIEQGYTGVDGYTPAINNTFFKNATINFTVDVSEISFFIFCYQEFANVSTDCGGLSTGNYGFSATITNPENAIDGNWNSLASFGYPNQFVYINYTVPTNALQSIWQIKTKAYNSAPCYWGTPFLNHTINSSNCWNNNIIQTRVSGASSSFGTEHQCYNGTTWISLFSCPNPGSSGLYEEAMIWNLTNISYGGIRNITITIINETGGIVNKTTITFTGNILNYLFGIPVTLIDGVYNWFAEAVDIASNYVATTLMTLIVDTTPSTFISQNYTLAWNNNDSWVYKLNVTITEINLNQTGIVFEGNNYSIYNIGGNVWEFNFTKSLTYIPYTSSFFWWAIDNATNYAQSDIYYFNVNCPTSTSINTFNNSYCIEKMTYIGNENKIRYLSVPNSVLVLANGYLNLSGYGNIENLLEKGNSTSQYSSGDFLIIYQAYDDNWDSMAIFNSVGSYLIENFTIDYHNGSFIEWKTRQAKGSCIGGIGFGSVTRDNSCYNFNTHNYTSLALYSGGFTYPFNCTGYYLIPSDCISNNNLSVRTNFTASTDGAVLGFFESSILYSGNFLNNVSLTIGNFQVWNYSKNFTQTNNKTNNLALTINKYLNTTYLIGTNYIIPFIFHSDTAGILQYLDLLFNNYGFLEISQTYNNQTIEGASETFYLNLFYDNNYYLSITADLIYNGISYAGTPSGSGTNLTFSRTIAIPNINSTTNLSFYWNIKEVNTNGSIEYYNSTTKSQNVVNVDIDDCSNYTNMIYNMTLYDEASKSFINPTTTNTTIEATLLLSTIGTTNYALNKSKIWQNINPAKICLNVNLSNFSYRVDMIVSYIANGYVEEFYYIDNGVLSNNSNPTTSFYDLLTSDSTSFLVTYQNEDYLYIEGAIIDVWRKYIGTGEFISVEHGKTDAGGQTRLHLVTEDVIYKFLVWKNGILLYTSPEYLALCQATPCQINLRKPFGEEIEGSIYGNIIYSLDFNESQKKVTLTFATKDGTSTTMLMNVTKSTTENTTICSDTITSSGGTLVCIIPQVLENTTYIAQITKDGKYFGYKSFSLLPKAREIFGSSGLILSVLSFLTLALMGISSGIAVIVFGLIGLIFAGLLMIFESGSILGLGSAIIWLIIAGIIIIWKINERRVS